MGKFEYKPSMANSSCEDVLCRNSCDSLWNLSYMRVNGDISNKCTDINFEAIILDFPTEQSRWGLCFLEMETTPAGSFYQVSDSSGLDCCGSSPNSSLYFASMSIFSTCALLVFNSLLIFSSLGPYSLGSLTCIFIRFCSIYRALLSNFALYASCSSLYILGLATFIPLSF